MSTIEQLRKNFQYSSNDEQFKQIPQSRPLRRNQSQQFEKINNMPFNNNQDPINFKEKSDKLLSKNISILNPQLNPPKILSQSKSTLNIKNNGFNPMNHIPPKYDIYGYLRPYEKRIEDLSVLKNRKNIKIPWPTQNTNKSGAITLSELKNLRRKEKIPDISYDLDKDGYVGNVDLVISKRFDVDNDGKLNQKEKAAAYEGISKGVENEYIWNVDNQGGLRDFRLLQKRGKFIDAEDFWPIRETYPEHPLSKIKPHCSTFSELQKLRKEEKANHINKVLAEYEEKNPAKLIYSENKECLENNKNKIKPLFTSMQQIKDDLNKKARVKCGLEENIYDVRDRKNHPSLNYIYDPKFKTKNDLINFYKKENLEESKKLLNTKFKSDIQRLEERENEIFAKLYNEKEGKTYNKIKDEERKKINEYNIKTFSNETIGVHGQELPKFAESEKYKEFWKFKDGYCENPKYQSQCEYLESIKYYKPPGEELLLNEHRDEDPKLNDPFKSVHILEAKNKKENLITKLNNINIFKNFDPNKPISIDFMNRKQHIYRWTTLVNQFAPNKFKKGRFFDSLPKENEKKEEEMPKMDSPGSNGFFADYMNNNNETNSVDKKDLNINLESVPLTKDYLFQKYSTKDPTKTNLPKNSVVRTKGL